MNKRVHQLDLTTLSYEGRVGFLLYMLVEKGNAITFNLSADPRNTMLLVGKNIRAFGLPSVNNCEPLVIGKANDNGVILTFLLTKLKETNQCVFKRWFSEEMYTNTEYDRIVISNEIDWERTVFLLVGHSQGDIRVSERDIDGQAIVTVTSVGGVLFNVRVGSLGRNPDDKEVVMCQDAILTEYRQVFPVIS